MAPLGWLLSDLHSTGRMRRSSTGAVVGVGKLIRSLVRMLLSCCLLRSRNPDSGAWAELIAYCAGLPVSSSARRRGVVPWVTWGKRRGGGGGARVGGAGLLWSPFCWLHYWVIGALARRVRRISSASGQV